jgi:hypothetical protein
MRRIRPRLARIAAGWLVFQICVFVSVPAALCGTMTSSSTVEECTCEHGDGQICPMHHTRSKSKPNPYSRDCYCGSPADPIASLGATLIGQTAVLAPARTAAMPVERTTALVPRAAVPLDSPSVPDPPPPRA